MRRECRQVHGVMPGRLSQTGARARGGGGLQPVAGSCAPQSRCTAPWLAVTMYLPRVLDRRVDVFASNSAPKHLSGRVLEVRIEIF